MVVVKNQLFEQDQLKYFVGELLHAQKSSTTDDAQNKNKCHTHTRARHFAAALTLTRTQCSKSNTPPEDCRLSTVVEASEAYACLTAATPAGFRGRPTPATTHRHPTTWGAPRFDSETAKALSKAATSRGALGLLQFLFWRLQEPPSAAITPRPRARQNKNATQRSKQNISSRRVPGRGGAATPRLLTFSPRTAESMSL